MPAVLFRSALALLWLVAAIAKATQPQRFFLWLEVVLGVNSPVGHALGWAVIVGEGALGAALLLGGGRRLSLQRAFGWVSWTGAAVAAAVTFSTRSRGECGCFGSLVEGSVPTRLIVAGAIMWLSFELLRSVGRTSGPGRRTGAPAPSTPERDHEK